MKLLLNVIVGVLWSLGLMVRDDLSLSFINDDASLMPDHDRVQDING